MNHTSYASPDLYPLSWDIHGDRVEFVKIDEAFYRTASFLDERIRSASIAHEWAPWSEVEQAAQTLSGDVDFIFHIGHAGSTLLSRLVGATRQTFSVREPAILRTLARLELQQVGSAGTWTLSAFRDRLDIFVKFLARVYRPTQRSLVKATSFVGEIAPLLLDRSSTSRAILMFVSPQIYLATILGGSASRAELLQVSSQRLARLRRVVNDPPWRIGDLSPGELAALGWACEIVSLARVSARFGDRILWLDFEDFLARPAAGLTAVLRHLHGAADQDEVAALLRSIDLSRYSKAPDQYYSPALRRQVISAALGEHRAEIERGLDWLTAVGRAHAVVANAARTAAAAPRLI